MALNVEMAERLIKAAWYESLDAPPDKFVVVMDVDRADPAEVLAPMRAQLPDRVREVEADVLYAYAQAHLEAWYFADADNLRHYLGRSLGHVDTSKPDKIINPKLHCGTCSGMVGSTRLGSPKRSPEPWTRPGSPSAAPASGRSWTRC